MGYGPFTEDGFSHNLSQKDTDFVPLTPLILPSDWQWTQFPTVLQTILSLIWFHLKVSKLYAVRNRIDGLRLTFGLLADRSYLI